MARLSKKALDGPTLQVAHRLIGSKLVRVLRGERLAGRIIEVEAYGAFSDPASHAYIGETAKNRVMYLSAGRAYVYFTYGFHYCLNVVTEPPGVPAAVLIRGLEPLEGLNTMKKLRKSNSTGVLCSGPGRVTQALAIDAGFNGLDMINSETLFLETGPDSPVVRTKRVGVSAGEERLWRFVENQRGRSEDGRAERAYITRRKPVTHGVVG